MSPVEAATLSAGAHPPGRGHHLGDRQRAARLPHRPVPDPRTRHQRQDALRRAADERRRPVRDRRRRLRARSTSSSSLQENYLRWDSLGEFLALAESAFEHLADDHGQRRAPRSWPTPSTAPPAAPARRGQVPGPQGRPDRQPRQPLLPRPVLGPASWPRRPTTPSWPRPSRRSPERWPPTRRPSSPSCSPSRATRPTSAATTAPTRPRPLRSCGRRRPSPRP